MLIGAEVKLYGSLATTSCCMLYDNGWMCSLFTSPESLRESHDTEVIKQPPKISRVMLCVVCLQ